MACCVRSCLTIRCASFSVLGCLAVLITCSFRNCLAVAASGKLDICALIQIVAPGAHDKVICGKSVYDLHIIVIVDSDLDGRFFRLSIFIQVDVSVSSAVILSILVDTFI